MLFCATLLQGSNFIAIMIHCFFQMRRRSRLLQRSNSFDSEEDDEEEKKEEEKKNQEKKKEEERKTEGEREERVNQERRVGGEGEIDEMVRVPNREDVARLVALLSFPTHLGLQSFLYD